MQKNMNEEGNSKSNSDVKSKSSRSSKIQTFSLNQLIKKSPEFLKDKIFVTKKKDKDASNKFKFV